MLRFALALLAVLVVGALITKLTVTSGVHQFDGPERALADQALDAGRFMTDNPILEAAILARSVVSVETERPGDCMEPGFEINGAYPGHKASVRCYTLFRVPIARVSVTCGGAVYGVEHGIGV